MDIKKIKQIVSLLESSDIAEIEVKEGDNSVRISRNSKVITTNVPLSNYVTSEIAVPHAQAQQQIHQPAMQEENSVEDYIVLRSPMVGTFYRSPSPESPYFVKEGDTVKPDTVICIVEAMKMMNQIIAEHSGKIVKVLVKDGDPVEYGQPLFYLT